MHHLHFLAIYQHQSCQEMPPLPIHDLHSSILSVCQHDWQHHFGLANSKSSSLNWVNYHYITEGGSIMNLFTSIKPENWLEGLLFSKHHNLTQTFCSRERIFLPLYISHESNILILLVSPLLLWSCKLKLGLSSGHIYEPSMNCLLKMYIICSTPARRLPSSYSKTTVGQIEL